MKYDDVMFSSLKGLTIKEITAARGDEEVIIQTQCGRKFRMYHSQSCCEYVRLEDICGDLPDLIGSPLLMAEESSNNDNPPECVDSWTWTFYKLATIKGTVVLRWLGTSNGYYGESVSICEEEPDV